MERLLLRLRFEQAVNNKQSTLRRERDAALAYWQEMLLYGWLEWSRKQDDPAMMINALERAEVALGQLVEWYNGGGYWVNGPRNDDNLPVVALVSLVQEWLRLNDSEGTIRAIDLLLSWTEGNDAIDLLADFADEVSSCFNLTVKQSTYLLANNFDFDSNDLENSSAALVNRVLLLREAGWERLEKPRIDGIEENDSELSFRKCLW